MSWIVFALLAAFTWTVVNIFDKYILGHECRDPIIGVVIKSYMLFAVFSAASFVSGADIRVSGVYIGMSLAAGALMSAVFYFYYASIRNADVSKVVPIFSAAPIFVAILGAIFLGERFSAATYAGIALIVAGAITISIKHLRHHFTFDHAALLALCVALSASVRSILIKYPSDHVTIWPLLFWIGLGSIVAATPVLITHHGHIRIHSEKRFQTGIRHFLIVNTFDALAFLSFVVAISLGPVSLVTAILHTKPLMVFLSSVLLSIFRPKFLHEHLTPRILAKRIAGTILIVGGALLVI